MRLISLILVVLVIFTACKKNKFQTKPQLKLKSVNNYTVPLNGTLKVVIEYTDKEGDLSDTFYVRKIRTNKTVTTTVRDSFYYKVPEFPDTRQGEFHLELDYQTILSAITPPNIPGSNPPQKQPDTLIVKFAAKDKGNHLSDTLTIPQIIVIR